MLKLKNNPISLEQRGIAQILVILILLAGIIAGVYLVQHPAIFKPKAYEVNLPSNQYDEPPSLLISTSDNAQNLLKNVGSSADYRITFSESEDEISIEFEPQDELTEEAAKSLLNQTEVYYLRTLMWLLYNPFNAIDGPPIDAWYALCDHLQPDLLAKVGAEPTILKDGMQLACSDPPPTRDQFVETDPHQHFLYKKIPATVLVKMIETARLQRENKSLSENAKDLAFSMVPLLGSTINAIRNPGSDPDEVSRDTLVSSIVDIFGGAAVKGVAQIGKVAVSLGSIVKPKFVIPLFRNVPSPEYGDFASEVAKTSTQLKNRASLVVKLVPDNVITKPNTRRIVIRLAGSRITQEAYEQLFTDLGVIYGHISPWTRQHVISFDRIEQALRRKQGDIRFLNNADYDILANPLGFASSDGMFIRHINPRKNLLVIRSGVETRTITHEGIHYIQDLHGFTKIFDEAQYMMKEGLTDWILKAKRGYASAYDQEVGQIEIMIARLSNKGVDGVAIAEYSALSGNPKYFLEVYTRYVGDLDMRGVFANFYNTRRAQRLVPALGFLNLLDTEEDGNIEDTQIDTPSAPNNLPLTSNFLNCSYSEADESCPSGSAVCTGHTDDEECTNKEPELCFNLVQCQYDANAGSTCTCE